MSKENGIGLPENEESEEEIPSSELSSVTSHQTPPVLVTPQDLDDLFCVDQFLVVHKVTGITVLSCEVSMLDVNPQLVSGFLTAIGSLMKEISTNPTVRGRQAFKEIAGEEANFLIFAVEGELAVSTVMLNRRPSGAFKRKLKDFNAALEEEYHPHLENFLGDTDPFKDVQDLMERMLGIGYLNPMRIDRSIVLEDTTLTPIFMVAEAAQSGLGTEEGFYIEEVATEVVRKVRNFTYQDTVSGIIQLVGLGVIQPIRGKIYHVPLPHETDSRPVSANPG